jgi:hypothetical protein
VKKWLTREKTEKHLKLLLGEEEKVKQITQKD